MTLDILYCGNLLTAASERVNILLLILPWRRTAPIVLDAVLRLHSHQQADRQKVWWKVLTTIHEFCLLFPNPLRTSSSWPYSCSMLYFLQMWNNEKELRTEYAKVSPLEGRFKETTGFFTITIKMWTLQQNRQKLYIIVLTEKTASSGLYYLL